MSLPSDLYIANRWFSASGAPFKSCNPATLETVWEGCEASREEVNLGVGVAREAFADWSTRPFSDRIAFLEAFGKELQRAEIPLTEAISKETGKPLWESKTEVQAMIGKIALSIDAYAQRCAEWSPSHPTAKATARFKPHGVVAVFGPFNFPGHLPNGHIVPALLAGNCVVFKPSEYTPQVAALTLQCWERAGLPPGVLNLVQGGRETGANLALHPDLDGLFFTGSLATGLRLSEQFAKQPEKILALEMGGNNPLVISSISNLRAAALITLQSAFITAGQRCTCARTLIVVEDRCPAAFLDELVKLIQAIRVGPYTDTPEPFMGPVITPGTAKRLLDAQMNLYVRGAKPLLTMQLLETNKGFLTPGLLDITPMRHLLDDELFGPLLQLLRVPDFEAALQAANATQYGLCAGLLSDSEEEYRQFYQIVKAGVINWNTPLTGASSALPFGGVKRSGNHRPSAYYAADYCSYPVASLEKAKIELPSTLPVGIDVDL